MVDNENFDRGFGGHERQAQLFVECGEDVGQVGVGREPVTARTGGPSEPRQSLGGIVRSEFQAEIEFAGETGFIHDRPA